MATYCRGKLGEVAKGETAAVRLQFPIEVGTHEAQVLTLQKPSEKLTGFAAPAAGSACTQIDGTQYAVQLKAGDVDEEGILFVKSVGSTDTHVGYIEVKAEDALTTSDLPDNFADMEIDTSGRVVAKSEVHRRIDRAK